jgi:hypothetical protein
METRNNAVVLLRELNSEAERLASPNGRCWWYLIRPARRHSVTILHRTRGVPECENGKSLLRRRLFPDWVLCLSKALLRSTALPDSEKVSFLNVSTLTYQLQA